MRVAAAAAIFIVMTAEPTQSPPPRPRRRLYLLPAALFALVLAATPAAAQMDRLAWADDPAPAPATRFLDETGAERSLADYPGRVVLVNFWATWCAPCRREMASLDRLQAELGGPNFQVVPLSLDRAGVAAIAPFFAELGITHLPVLIDEDNRSAEAFGILGLPTTVLIDHRGYEVARLVGEADWSADDAKAMIAGQVETARAALPKTTAATCSCGGPKADRVRRYGTVGPPPEEP